MKLQAYAIYVGGTYASWNMSKLALLFASDILGMTLPYFLSTVTN